MTQAPRTRQRRWLVVAVVALIAIVVPAGAVAKKPPKPPAHIQILNVSDWHGNLDPASANGGAWNISARWDADEAAFAGATLRLTAGDDFGASPPLASFFDEVPAVQAERLMGISVNTFGNHDFDRGISHLQSMIDLARAPSTGSGGAHPGSPFRYVASNLSNLNRNLRGVLPIQYLNLDGARVAIIGIVNEEAPTLVSPGNFGTMIVTDGVVAATKYAREARTWGHADAVIVITHKGVNGVSPAPFGPLVDFAGALPPGLVDVVIGDHTNIQASGFAPNGVLWHENLSYGNGYAKTYLTVLPQDWGPAGYVLAKWMNFVTPGPAASLSADKASCPAPGPGVFCDQDIVSMLVPYRAQLAAALDGTIGTTTVPFDRGGNLERQREVPLGDLIADGMRLTYGTDFGYMNGGGIRSQFPACAYTPVNTALKRSNWDATHTVVSACAGGYAAGAPIDLVKGDVYTVLPFGNNVLTRTITGHQLWQMLENGVSKFAADGTNTQGRFPQISGLKFTFHYLNPSGCSGSETGTITWTCTTGPGHRVTAVTKTDGTPIPDDGTTYTVATIDFMNTGGDSYTMLADGQGTTRDRDANVFLTYMGVVGPALDPTTMVLDRITVLP